MVVFWLRQCLKMKWNDLLNNSEGAKLSLRFHDSNKIYCYLSSDKSAKVIKGTEVQTLSVPGRVHC